MSRDGANVRPRLGTKATQGINGEAELLQRQQSAVLGFVRGTDPCSYATHRGADWMLEEGGPVVCGVCHPPAPGLAVVPA